MTTRRWWYPLVLLPFLFTPLGSTLASLFVVSVVIDRFRTQETR